MRLILTILLGILLFVSYAQDPLRKKEIEAKNILKANAAFIWQGDTIQHDSLVYSQFRGDSVRFKYIDGAYSIWYYNGGTGVAQIPSDWNQTNISLLDFIKNKPDSIWDFLGIDRASWSTGKVLKFDSSGNLVVGTDIIGDPGSGIALADLDATSPLNYNDTMGVFSVASGYTIPTTVQKLQHDTAYYDKINFLGVSGTTTKTITLYKQNGTTLTTNFTDLGGSQTLANTSDATSHTVTLSSSGGSTKLVEGAGMSLATTGTSNDGIVTIGHSNSVTPDVASEGGSARTLAFGGSFNIPSVTYDAQGHIASKGSTTLTLPGTPAGTTDTNTTYDHLAVAATGGALLRLQGSDASVDDIKLVNGTGITATYASPTSINLLNTAPDQIVALTNGPGISITGTYPNFTVANTQGTDGNTTYSISSEIVTGGANLRLTGNDASTDNVKIAGSGTTTVTRTDISTITVGTPSFGTGTGTIAQGDDSRINNGQTAYNNTGKVKTSLGSLGYIDDNYFELTGGYWRPITTSSVGFSLLPFNATGAYLLDLSKEDVLGNPTQVGSQTAGYSLRSNISGTRSWSVNNVQSLSDVYIPITLGAGQANQFFYWTGSSWGLSSLKTINGANIYGGGNISLLPTVGGTLTGTLYGTNSSFSSSVQGTEFKFGTTGWTITESAGKLVFKYAGTAVLSLDQSGNVKAAAEVYRGGL